MRRALVLFPLLGLVGVSGCFLYGWGGPCGQGSDCGSQACCSQGWCQPSTPSSPGNCGQPSDCPSNQTCMDGYCLTSCNADCDCDPGQHCDQGVGVCVGDGVAVHCPPGASGGGDGGVSGGDAGSGGSTSGGVGTTDAGGGSSSGGTADAGDAGSSTSSGGLDAGTDAGVIVKVDPADPPASGDAGSVDPCAASDGGSGSGCPSKDFAHVRVGAACDTDADCGPNGLCEPPISLASGANATQWTSGYCTALNCDAEAPCPAGAECFFLPAGGTPERYSLCLADCGTDACRRPGYRCGSASQVVFACLPDCSCDCDCGPDLVCDEGACAPPCRQDADCGVGEICAAQHCEAAPPVSCTNCDQCGTGETCASGECAFTCEVDTDCPIGETCGNAATCR